MQPIDFEPIAPPSSAVTSSSEDSHPPGLPVRSGRLWAVTLGAGVVAGLTAWLGGEACHAVFKPPLHAANSRGLILKMTNPREVAAADAKNAGLGFALSGAAVGLGLGVAGALAHRRGAAAARAGLVGLVAGAAAGAGASLALFPAYNIYKARHPDEAASDLILPLLIHAGIWSALGAAGGLAFGLGSGERRTLSRAVTGGLVSAAIGAAGYVLFGALFFPAASTSRFVSEIWQTRLLARLGVAVLVAAAIAASVHEPGARHSPPAN
jgi:hypothetical protein